jgi:hypothetical protein
MNAGLATTLCDCRCGLVSGCAKTVFPHPETNPQLQPHTSHQTCTRVVPPEDGQIMPETCRDRYL